jgi:hypothetical protein
MDAEDLGHLGAVEVAAVAAAAAVGSKLEGGSGSGEGGPIELAPPVPFVISLTVPTTPACCSYCWLAAVAKVAVDLGVKGPEHQWILMCQVLHH